MSNIKKSKYTKFGLGSYIIPAICYIILIGAFINHHSKEKDSTLSQVPDEKVDSKLDTGIEIEEPVAVETVDWSSDTTQPTIISHSIESDKISVTLDDDLSGIDYNMVYGEFDDGGKIYPIFTDTTSGTVEFNIPSSNFTLYAYDLAGNMTETKLNIYE